MLQRTLSCFCHEDASVFFVRVSEEMFCSDFGRFNDIAKGRLVSTRLIDNILSAIVGTGRFSTLELRNGYLEVELVDSHENTTLTTVATEFHI